MNATKRQAKYLVTQDRDGFDVVVGIYEKKSDATAAVLGLIDNHPRVFVGREMSVEIPAAVRLK